LTGRTVGRTIGHTVHALAETAASYASEPASAAHTKLSISLPSELVEQVRLAAVESGVSVSGVIASALRRSIASVDQGRLDRALELDAEDNAAWANDALALTARAWADLTW
jgi:Arc/MetJ-type ribon-helix-helix transcriptional regulator